ncbi:MAG TPA: insulinase family protein, partial [Saprospiraceae bacterium]|nr:insulinase family protein [Saprospiraceae bacterium]
STPILEIAQLSSALSVLKTWASEAVLDPAWIEKERLNVIKNSPRLYGISTILQNKTVFAGTRYGDRIPADISAKLKELKPGAIKKFYNEWYRPDLMAVVIVGNNDVDITEQELIKVFSEIKKPVSKVPDTSANYVDGQILKTDIMANAQFTDSEVRILFQNQKRPVRDQFGYRQLIMNELINVMFQERFKTAEFKLSGVRKPGFLRPSGNTEFLFVNLFCSEGKVIEYLKPALIEIDRLRKIGFTEAELEKAKIYIGQKHSSEKDLTDDHQIDAMSEKMIWHYLDGEPLLDVHTQEEILKNYLPKIKLNEINKKFAQLTKEENCCILIKGNSGSIGTLSDASQIKKLIEEVRIK